mmetsp:Transcript_13592/g.32188  ORF Transcript_13592/g.32188 Transcript_13592/m.32188 type:complete len:112 (-) Transcript_13592:103-438(-)
MGLLKERLLSGVLGTVAVGTAYVSTQRLLWRSTAQYIDCLPGTQPSTQLEEAKERLLGAHARARLTRSWNEAVDSLFGAAIQRICSPVAAEPHFLETAAVHQPDPQSEPRD